MHGDFTRTKLKMSNQIPIFERDHLRTVLLEAINLDSSQCDLRLPALVKKVAAERQDLVESWGDSKGNHGKALHIEEENGDVIIVPLDTPFILG
jgi:hypothetical protein